MDRAVDHVCVRASRLRAPGCSELTRWVVAGEGEGIESSHSQTPDSRAHLAAAAEAAGGARDAVAMATVRSDVIPTRRNH